MSEASRSPKKVEDEEGALYLQKHNIPSALNKILTLLVETKPQRPHECMLDEVMKISQGNPCLRGMNYSVPAWTHDNLQVCVVGDSAPAHVMLSYFASLGVATTCLVTTVEDASMMTSAACVKGVRCQFPPHCEISGDVYGSPHKISCNPEKVIPHSNVIILPVPSYLLLGILPRIAPFIAPSTILIASPGGGGFDYIAKSILAEKASRVILCSLFPLPFAATLTDYGREVLCDEFETSLTVYASPQYTERAVMHVVSLLVGQRMDCEITFGGSIMTSTMLPLGPCVHPSHLFRMLKDGVAHTSHPLFYATMDAESGKIMNNVSKEISDIARCLNSALHHCDVEGVSVFDFEFANYSNPDCHTIDQLYAHNPLYANIRAPFKKGSHEGIGIYELDIKCRYLIEDIPFGLCVWRGLAELVGVETPTMDKLILFFQAMMDKRYLEAMKADPEKPSTRPTYTLSGRDVCETTAPQRFRIKTLDQLLQIID